MPFTCAKFTHVCIFTYNYVNLLTYVKNATSKVTLCSHEFYHQVYFSINISHFKSGSKKMKKLPQSVLGIIQTKDSIWKRETYHLIGRKELSKRHSLRTNNLTSIQESCKFEPMHSRTFIEIGYKIISLPTTNLSREV